MGIVPYLMIIELTPNGDVFSPWNYLCQIALEIKNKDVCCFKIDPDTINRYKPLSVEVQLIINQGGIQHRGVTIELKMLFKEYVLPWLMDCAGVTIPLTGHLELHFAQDTLQRAFLHLK